MNINSLLQIKATPWQLIKLNEKQHGRKCWMYLKEVNKKHNTRNKMQKVVN